MCLEPLYGDQVVLIFFSCSLSALAYSVGGGSVMDTANVVNLYVIASS